MESQEVNFLPDLPKVEYSDRIKSPECPYNVEINPTACLELLLLTGVNKNEVGNLTVRVDRRQSLERIPVIRSVFGTLGEYKPGDKSLTIYTDYLWDKYKKVYHRVEKILEKREGVQNEVAEEIATSDSSTGPFTLRRVGPKEKNLFPELTSGKRFSWYLRVVPPERGMEFAKKLISRRMTRNLRESSLAHEAKHAADMSLKRHSRLNYSLQNISAATLGWLGALGATSVANLVFRGDAFYYFNTSLEAHAQYFTIIPMAVLLALPLKQKLNAYERDAENFAKEHANDLPQRLISFSPK